MMLSYGEGESLEYRNYILAVCSYNAVLVRIIKNSNASDRIPKELYRN